MKKLSVVSILLLIVMLSASVVSAQTGLPGSGWWSGEQVQNVSDSQATVVITAYDSASTATYSEQVTLAGGASVTFTPHNYFTDMPSGFQGSAVVSADQPIKAITNVTNQPSGSFGVTGGMAAAQYQGTDGTAVADTLYFPLAKGDHYGKTSSFYIQNAGSANATSVVATFTMRNGDTHTYNLPTIGPNQMVVFSVHDSSTYDSGIADNDGKIGGLVVAGDQSLAGVVLEHDTTGDPAVVLNGTRGFTSSDFDTKAYAPVIKRERYSRFTGLQVQNTSGGNIDVTVTYAGTAGACAGNTYQDTATGIPDGEAKTFVHYGDANTNLPANCTATAIIEGTGNFVAVVNEQQTSGDAYGITYSAMIDGAATTKVSAPLFKDNRYGTTTGLQVMNVGTAATTSWTATFMCTGAASFTAVSDDSNTGQIAQGSAYLFFTPSDDGVFTTANPFSADSVNCAVTIEADQAIVAIANEMGWPGGTKAIDDNNYEGFNLTP
jgi:hypothetical protein